MMASTGTYGDPDSHLGGGSAGLYVNQNGGTPPAQQAQAHMHTDPELQLRENIHQLQQGSEMLHGPPHQMAQMNQVHHHFQTPTRPAHSPQHMAQSAQSVMGLDDNPFGDHDSANRKRSKVSRACDECRRKKIRCDATSENGPEACSSCKRTGARCQFSRQPMKRGPSKGYIKELADRLNSLENQVQHQHPSAPGYDFGPIADPALSNPQPSVQFPRKRTHSMTDNFQDIYGRPNGTNLTNATDVLYQLTHEEHPLNGSMAHNNRRMSFSEMTLAGNLITGSNEATIKAYYATIHPTLPLLPHDSASLNRLSHCPSKLREAFFLALECSVRSFATRALQPIDITLVQLIRQCYDAVDAAKHFLGDADSLQSLFNKMIYCQSLLFLIIAADRPSPGRVEDPAELLGRVAGRINETDIMDAKVSRALREQDTEVFELSRRTYWVAFILDRFHATSRSRALALPLQSASVTRDHLDTLGETALQLARIADVVGQVAHVTKTSHIANLDPTSPYAINGLAATSPASLYLDGQIKRCRESLGDSSLPPNSPPHLALLYLEIFLARLSEPVSPTELLAMNQDLLGRLTNGPISPLHHIFASLVATSFTDLSDRVETQVEAHASMREMADSVANGRILYNSVDGIGWDAALLDLLNEKKAPTPGLTAPEQTSPVIQPNMAGLQHLAAAAVGERESADSKPTSSGHDAATSALPEPGNDLTAAMRAASEAAKAQATAAAAQQQLQNDSTHENNGSNPDTSSLVKDAF